MQRFFRQALREIAKRWGIEEGPHIEGRLALYALPFENEAEYAWWWPRMKRCERARYVAREGHNLLTVSGRTQLLTYLASQTPTTPPFAQFLGVGSLAINSVSPGDTSVQGEFYRTNPSGVVISNDVNGVPNAVDLTTIFSGSNGNGNWYSLGLFGGGAATSTTGTGTLYTHALLVQAPYVKATGIVAVDYTITLT